MTIAALTVAHLKHVKNTVIGNPQAKNKHAHDASFIATLVDAVNPPVPASPTEPDTAHDALAIEAAVVIASLSASDAALLVLLRAQAPRALLYALSRLPPLAHGPSHAPLRAALARALRALASGTSDVVGPALWGLLKQPSRDLLDEARRSIDVFVSTEALDIYLPLLLFPSTTGPPGAASIATATAVAQMLASTLRTPNQLALVTAWVPPATRVISTPFSPTSPTSAGVTSPITRSKRGWEKTAVPGTGGIPHVVRWLLALLAGSKDNKLMEAVLNALAALVKENPVLAAHLGRGNGEKDTLPLTTIMAFTKSRSSDVQIAACLCITHTLRALPPAPPPAPPPHFHGASAASHSHGHGHGHSHSLSLGHTGAGTRSSISFGSGASGGGSAAGRSGSGAASASASGAGSGVGTGAGLSVEEVGVRTVLGVVNRVLGLLAGETAQVRTKACFVLHYLVSDDAQLCHAAFDRGCLDVLGGLIQDISPQEPAPPEWEEGESEALQALREAALTALAALALASDDARRRIASPPPSLLPCLARALRATQHTGTRYAAAQCVRAMARSVSVLRTSIVDSGLGMDVLRMVLGRPLGGRFGGAASGVGGGEGRGGSIIPTTAAAEGAVDPRVAAAAKEGGLGEDRRVLGAALSAVCNIVNDFSPLRPIYLEEGLMPRLVYILREMSDGPLRLSALWAVKNLVRKASTETKRDVMSHVGWAELDSFLTDADEAFQEQAFNLLRNLAENEDGIAMIFRELGTPVLGRLVRGLHAPAPDVVLQAAYALANLANGTAAQQDSILGASGLLPALATCLADGPPSVRRPCVSAVLTLAQRNPRRRREMQEAGIVGTLRRLSEWSGHGPALGAGAGAGGMGLSPPTRGGGGGAGGYSGTAWGGGGQAGVPGTWSGSGGVMHAALGAGRVSSAAAAAAAHLAHEDDREVVGRARLALEWLEHGETYVS